MTGNDMSNVPNPRRFVVGSAPRWHKLPNGLSIQYQNKSEALYVYKEVFEDQIYLRHGIAIKDGDCIFDVGANIGLFTMFVQSIRIGCAIHAFEPSPELCGILTANVGTFSNVTIHQFGLSDTEKEAVFTFYPNYSILSGFYADEAREREMLRMAIRNQFCGRFRSGGRLEDRHLDSLVEEMLAQKTEYTCRLQTISTIIEKECIRVIDLLKVDVEKSELDVLRGIRDRDWGLIRQIVIEVHEAEGDTVQWILSLLEEKGFRITLDAERQLKDSRIVNLYSRRA